MTPALLSLFLAAFSIGTTELVPAGLLPRIAEDLHVSVPTAGLLISVYAAGVAVGGPIVSLLTLRFPRKPTILALMAIFVLGHAVGATAPNYTVLMLARVIISLSHGSFFGIAAIISVSLVPPERRGSALALVFAGISVANILGVPIGTLIGNAFGWRAAFWSVGSLAIIAGAAMWFAIPASAGQRDTETTLRDQFRALAHPLVWTTYAIIFTMMIGFFAVFTFVTPYLTDVSGVPSGIVPFVLLLFGLGATIGILVGGRIGDRFPARTLVWSFPVQVVIFALMLMFGTQAIWAGLLVLLIGAANNVNNSVLQSRILTGAAAAPDLASTLISSVFNVGIALGAYLGAAALEHGIRYADLPWFGLVSSAAAGLLAAAAIAGDRQRRRRLATA